MSFKKYTWEFEEQDVWRFDTFDTIEDCIEGCINFCVDGKIKIPNTIVIGEVEKYIPIVDADWLLYHLSEQAYDECGEVADNWCAECASQKELNKLTNQLTEVVNQWLAKIKNEPNFYSINNVVEIEIGEMKYEI